MNRPHARFSSPAVSRTASRLPYACLALALLAAPTAAQAAQSTYGHARARALANLGRLPTPRDIVERDIVNYHRHRLPLPNADQAVSLELRMDPSTGPRETFWLQVGYATMPEGDRALAPPCCVALVVDTSGSMSQRGKLANVQRGLLAFVERLRPDDLVALVTFADEATTRYSLQRRGDGRAIAAAIAALAPNGSTNLHAGVMRGIAELRAGTGDQAERRADPGDADDSRVLIHGRMGRRILVLTDGIANVGTTAPATIAREVAAAAAPAAAAAAAAESDAGGTASPIDISTIDISTIGVGEQIDTVLLQQLAERSRGLFHFVADSADIDKVFVQEADSLLVPVARDCELTVTFDAPVEVSLFGHAHVGGDIGGDGDDSGRSQRHEPTRLRIRLPDLNAGATGVVMMRCQMPPGGNERGATTINAHAELAFSRAADPARHGTRHRRTAGLAVDDTAAPRHANGKHRTNHGVGRRAGNRVADVRPDPLVRKNAAIAVLARGLADMARESEHSCWAAANRHLQRARDDARGLFPGDDVDVQRVRDLAAAHARTLRSYLQRFRQL
ncbi:MAG: VWA domain-containing protein [Planctomycetota bacterium]